MKKKTNGSFKKGHKVPILWRKKIGDKNRGKHHSVDTEFKKGHKINLGCIHSKKRNKNQSNVMKNKMVAKDRWKLDNNRTKELQEKGFRVIRLWEYEIKVMKLNEFGKILE